MPLQLLPSIYLVESRNPISQDGDRSTEKYDRGTVSPSLVVYTTRITRDWHDKASCMKHDLCTAKSICLFREEDNCNRKDSFVQPPLLMLISNQVAFPRPDL